jgi:N utilization substance protein B
MKGALLRPVRQAVIEALYESETSAHDPLEALHRRLEWAATTEPLLGGKGALREAESILSGIHAHLQDVDERLQIAAPRYPLDSMAVIDRNILRLAIWELLTDASAPVAAVINEAVELAHRYGGDSSPSFINGVLRTVSQEIAVRGRGESPAATQGATVPTSTNDQER